MQHQKMTLSHSFSIISGHNFLCQCVQGPLCWHGSWSEQWQSLDLCPFADPPVTHPLTDRQHPEEGPCNSETPLPSCSMTSVKKGFIPSPALYTFLISSLYIWARRAGKDLPLNVFTTSFRALQTASSADTSSNDLHSVQAQQHLLLSAVSPRTTRETNPSLGGVLEIP